MFGQYGDIILVHGDNIISEAIQNLTHSFFSHAVLCTEPGKIAEMTRYGFRHWDNYYLTDPRPFIVLRHRILFPENPRAHYYIKNIKNCINNYIKNPPKYDYFEVLNQAIKLILSRGEDLVRDGETYIPFSVLLLASERLICSAMVDSVYEAAGIELFPNRVSKHTTPADIASLSTGKKPALLEVFRSPDFKN